MFLLVVGCLDPGGLFGNGGMGNGCKQRRSIRDF